jgi:hypothetical protein
VMYCLRIEKHEQTSGRAGAFARRYKSANRRGRPLCLPF